VSQRIIARRRSAEQSGAARSPQAVSLALAGRLVVLHALLASQPRLGEHSALRRSLTSSALYDKNVWRDVFRFL
jgi:hypothetical protein